MTEPLIYNNFDQGISDSPHKGYSRMSRVDIEDYPGAVKVNREMNFAFHDAYTSTFTADAGTDICTSDATVPNTPTPVTLTTTGTLPAGLSTSTNYFIIKQSGTTFKLATNVTNADAGTAIDITDAGSGTHTVTTVDPGTINHFVIDPRTDTRFAHDSNGRVWYYSGGWRLLNGNTLTNAAGNGLALIWTSDDSSMWLFVFRNALIDVVDVYGSADKGNPQWDNNGWKSLNSGAGSGNRHHAITGQDGITYFTDDRYIGSIRETPGDVFDPTDSASYSFNNQALDTPQGEVLVHLDELDVDLLAAGSSFNKVYPWDRVSDSFRIPWIVPENSVQRIKNIGGTVYILAGSWGNIYQSQGNFVTLARQMPRQLVNNSDGQQSNPIAWGGIDALNGKLLFGISGVTTDANGSWLLYPDGRLIQDQIPTAGALRATAFQTQNNFYHMGYQGGADAMTGLDRYTALEGIIETDFRRVATKVGKATYSTLEVVIAKPESAGNIQVGYREDTESSYTTVDTFTCDGTNTTFMNQEVGLSDIENIQLQFAIDDDVELVEVRLLP